MHKSILVIALLVACSKAGGAEWDLEGFGGGGMEGLDGFSGFDIAKTDLATGLQSVPI